MNAPLFDPEAQGWTLRPDDGFIGHVGPFWERAEAGRIRYGFLADSRHANLLAVVQGGMVMTFADRVMGLEAWRAADGRPSATLQFGMQFQSSVALGDFVETAPRISRVTRSVVFVDATILVGDRIAATAQGIWKVLASHGA